MRNVWRDTETNCVWNKLATVWGNEKRVLERERERGVTRLGTNEETKLGRCWSKWRVNCEVWIWRTQPPLCQISYKLNTAFIDFLNVVVHVVIVISVGRTWFVEYIKPLLYHALEQRALGVAKTNALGGGGAAVKHGVFVR